ncbi:MAG: alpha/beta-hydrolase N-terminal domain-containing protein, partial [Acidimicrobiales bacterium]
MTTINPKHTRTKDKLMARFKGGLRWIFTRHLCFGGLVGALLFFVLSMLPSLLARGWTFQGVISGMNLVIGYGIGSAASAIARHYHAPEPSPQVKHRVWQGFAALAVILGLSSLAWGDSWNDATREIMDQEPVGTTQWIGILA